MRLYRFSLLLATAAGILLIASGSTGRPTVAQPRSRYFPQTGHTVQGRFLEYWETHGGLMQQGYPLTDELQERSALNGQVYTVQYFERAVFELHPENNPPYDVLLSLLGVFEYQKRYGDEGAPNQHANSDNPITFSETGKTLGGKFRAYWESHGGLAQQGYPISNEFQETSALNGQTYTVQYFQRGVFEDHPENGGTPFEVLLSQLGTFSYRARYTTLTIPPLAPGHLLGGPRASNDYLIWQDAQPVQGQQWGGVAIRALNLRTNQPLTVTDAPGDQSALAISGSLVVWQDSDPTCLRCRSTIRGKDLATGQTFTVASAMSLQGQLAVGGRKVAWIEDRQRLMLKDLDSGVSTTLATATAGRYLEGPAMSSRILVWSEGAPNPPGQTAPPAGTLYAFDFTTGTTITLGTIHPWPQVVLVSDHHAIWNSDGVLWAADTSVSPAISPIAESRTISDFKGEILVGVTDSAPGDEDIWGMNVTLHQAVPLVTAAGPQLLPVIAGDWLVWQTSDGAGGWRLDSMPLAQAFAAAPPSARTPIATPDTAGSPTTTPFPPSPLPVSPTPGPDIRLSAQGIAGDPVVAGHYVFYYKDIPNRGNTLTPLPEPTPVPYQALYAGDADSHGTYLIKNMPAGNLALASDGQSVAWVENGPNGTATVHSYDLRSQTERILLADGAPHQIAGVARDNGLLYYEDRVTVHSGIYAYDPSTRQERLISSSGHNPVARDGTLLWNEVQAGAGNLPPAVSLHLVRQDGSGGNTVLATQRAELSNYAVSGDSVVWAYMAPAGDQRVYLYSIARGTSRSLSAGPAVHPVVDGHVVAWSQPLGGDRQGWTMQIYHTDNNILQPLLGPILSRTQIWGIVRDEAAAFTVDNEEPPSRDLYVFGLASPSGP